MPFTGRKGRSNTIEDREDAFGNLLYHYLRTGEGTEIVERDDGFIDTAWGAKAYFDPFEEWPDHHREAMRYVRGKVLDVGVGAGRVALYLQQRGHEVWGIDTSPLALKVCRERGLKHTRLMPATQLSSRLGTFDTIVMMGNNFGLVNNPRRAKWMLRRFGSMTSSDGRILADTRDPLHTDKPEHLAYHELNRKRGRMPGQVRIRVRFKTYATPWCDYLMVSKGELEDILHGTGWRPSTYVDSVSYPGLYIAVLEKA